MTVLEPREVPLGGIRAMTVQRTLPQRDLPTVGAWCFFDRFDDARSQMRVLPHPHTGLQTVTWPTAGEIHHRDTVGSDVIVRPRELNLMTAGHGIAHSELSSGDLSAPLRGLQLWTALPDEALESAPLFEQHTTLPDYVDAGIRATVLLGSLGGVTSPATSFTPLVGADATVSAGASVRLPLDPGFENAVMLLDGDVEVNGSALDNGPLRYLARGADSLTLTSRTGARVMLIGGEPFDADLVMWWNFVGRNHGDIVQARDEWESGSDRFGTIAFHGDDRIPAPPLPNVRLTPRRRGIRH